MSFTQEQVQAQVKKMEQDWERKSRLYEERLETHIAMAKMLECEICSKYGSIVQLLGGRNTTLCREHLNVWHEFLASHELKREYNDAQADFYVAIYQCSEETARERNQIWQDVIDAIYAFSGEWLKEEKTKWPKQ